MTLPNNANVVCCTSSQLAYDPDESDNWEIGGELRRYLESESIAVD